MLCYTAGTPRLQRTEQLDETRDSDETKESTSAYFYVAIVRNILRLTGIHYVCINHVIHGYRSHDQPQFWGMWTGKINLHTYDSIRLLRG